MTGARGPVSKSDVVPIRPGVDTSSPAGTTGRRSTNKPAMPAWLDANGKAEWKRLIEELENKKLTQKVDLALVAMCADAFSKFVTAQKMLKAGVVHRPRDDRGPTKAPAWQIYREAATLYQSLAKELLATPNARVRAQVPEVGDGEEEGILD